MDSVEDVRARMEAVDRAVRDGDPVPDDTSINVTSTFRRYRWGSGAMPAALTKEASKMLGLQDRTMDKRWVKHFNYRAHDIGLYRTVVGFYWLLRYDPAIGEHWFDHVGTAAATVKRFGDAKAEGG